MSSSSHTPCLCEEIPAQQSQTETSFSGSIVEWLLFSYTPAEPSVPGDKISGYTDLLPHAVHPSFIFLTPGWKWKSKAHNQNRKNWKMWGNWVMYLRIDVCHNPLSYWFSTVSNRIVIRQQLELPSTCLCFFQIIGDKVPANRNDSLSVNHLGTL